MSTLPPPSTLPAPQGRFGRGLIADPTGHMMTGAHKLLGTFGSLPPKASLRSTHEAPIGDQGLTSACVGWAVARGIHTTFEGKGDLIEFPSPTGIYTLARAIDRTPNADGSLPPLLDEGSMPNQAMRGLEFGVSPISAWEFNAKEIDREPTLTELQKSSEFVLTGYYKVRDASLDARIIRVKQAIANRYAVCFAIDVDHSFEDTANEVVGARKGVDIGGHYLCAVGYETINRKTYVEFANSWAKTWGRQGYSVGNEEFIARWSDIVIMSVRRVAA